MVSIDKNTLDSWINKENISYIEIGRRLNCSITYIKNMLQNQEFLYLLEIIEEQSLGIKEKVLKFIVKIVESYQIQVMGYINNFVHVNVLENIEKN